MNISLRRKGIAVSLLVSLALLSGCGAQAAANTQAPAATANKAAPAATSPAASTEQPVAPEQNPVGDIPDNQAFVT